MCSIVSLCTRALDPRAGLARAIRAGMARAIRAGLARAIRAELARAMTLMV